MLKSEYGGGGQTWPKREYVINGRTQSIEFHYNAIFHVKISLTASTNHIAKRAYNDNNNKEALIICILVSSSVS